MFTGIIQEVGTVSGFVRKGSIARLDIRSALVIKTAEIGDSISVNGVCLTVTSIEKYPLPSPYKRGDKGSPTFVKGDLGEYMQFDLSAETLGSTNLGTLKTEDRVNLEPALRPSDRLGGHFVTGHIDGVGRVRQKRPAGETTEIEIEAPDEVMRYVVKKGSIAVDGISLTIVDAGKDSFRVVIIPHTVKVTTIGQKGVNDTVNLEADIIGKYVAKFLYRSGVEQKDREFTKKLEVFGFK